MNAGNGKRNRSALEWGILPQAPWDLALTGQDWWTARSRAMRDRNQSRRPGRHSGCVPALPCPSPGCKQYMKSQKQQCPKSHLHKLLDTTQSL
jgi:hypothetical protein